MFFCKVAAFLKKNFLIEMSYRLQFILNLLSILIHIGSFYFIAKLFGKATVPYLKEYGGEYFPFVLIGIAFSGYFMTALRSLSSSIREEQMMGTLEAIFLTPTKTSTIVIALPCWDFLFSSINVLFYLLVGTVFLGVKFCRADILAVFIILVLTIITLSSIGIISAAFIIVLKRGNPISWVVGAFSTFFGGAYFPITILPDSLRAISYLLPITYTLRALRHALLQGYSFWMLLPDTLILFVFALILLPLSIFIFQYAVKKAKIYGSLAHY